MSDIMSHLSLPPPLSKPERILITGVCGFLGHHMVEHFIKTRPNVEILGIDKLSYASRGFDRLRSNEVYKHPRVHLFTTDLCNPITPGLGLELSGVDYIIHTAADTHVDNSISDPVPFVYNNVMSTLHLLEFARKCKKLKKFFYFSTDEVFGAAPDGVAYKEWDRHKPTNPYSASKAAAEDICLSYENTYKVPIIIINCMNLFGERQHVEKFIPKVIKKVLNNEEVEIHADPECKNSGTRYYIHCRNVCSAVDFLMEKGTIGDKYNITGEKEISNLEMAQMIAKVLGKDLKYKLINFHADRPGHDLKYRLDGNKLWDLGWKLPLNFYESLKKTILWTLENKEWLDWDLYE